MARVVAAALLAMVGAVFGPAGPARAADRAPERQARVERLARGLLAPCCYKEPVSRHHSESATKMRLEIESMVAAGKTDEEILAFYRERYGERIIAPPETDPSPWVKAVPWLAVVAGGVAVIGVLARWRKQAPPAHGVTAS